MFRPGCAVFLCCLVAGASADTVYIRDTLYVSLRAGESAEHRILQHGLPSGTALELLESNGETGYSLVRTGDGLEGWIQTQYLVEQPIALNRLEAMTARLEELEAQYQQTLLRLEASKESNETLLQDRESLSGENESLSRQLNEIKALAADVIAIEEENRLLDLSLEDMGRRLGELQAENESLDDDRVQGWLLAGAGVLLAGLLLGFWAGRRIYRRQNTSGWA